MGLGEPGDLEPGAPPTHAIGCSSMVERPTVTRLMDVRPVPPESTLRGENMTRTMDVPWTEKQIRLLATGTHTNTDGDVTESEFGYYAQKALAQDLGEPELMLDAIQLDLAINQMKDIPAKMALILKCQGIRDETIGAHISDTGQNRTGYQLVQDGIKEVQLIERLRYEERREG